MNARSVALPLGLLAVATACGDILGIDGDSTEVECNSKQPCGGAAYSRGGNLGSDAGSAGIGNQSRGGTGGAVASGGALSSAGMPSASGALSSGGSSVGSGSGGTGGVAIASGGYAGESGGMANDGGTTAASGAGGTIASGGTQEFGGGTTGTAGTVTTNVGGTSGTAGTVTTNVGGGAAGNGGVVNVAGAGGSTAGTAGRPSGGVGGGLGGGGVSGGGVAGVAAVGNVGAAGAAPECSQGTFRCRFYYDGSFQEYAQACDRSGNWGPEARCDDYCSKETGCTNAPSCSTGPTLNPCLERRTCCNSLPIPGGNFDRSIPQSPYDLFTTCSSESPCPATLSPFLLDTFEVTVGRFRRFVDAYADAKPKPGSGKNSNNQSDPGWKLDWTALLPATQSEIRSRLLSETDCPGRLYTEDPGGNEFRPINCVDWYMAFAFCIWDGGRLPTEVEWNFATTGGSLARFFPWSVPPDSDTISLEHAIYNNYSSNAPTVPSLVGKTPKGIGLWGQYDLGGNVYEWLADVWRDTYPDPAPCVDCAFLDWEGTGARVMRGGSYLTTSEEIASNYRNGANPLSRFSGVGFRCARGVSQ